ncbi:hypothetical protein [Actinokineospora inagensis]|uniref:hypothetical protein n=1 Tax=Actinokineospora inagensis TaxID=103730 RepID=UPI00040AF9C8|nr:hypothetical protein [Actinokineospora inagensis]
MITFRDTADLEQALRRAAEAHSRHEQRTGHPDPDWPRWYAEHLTREHRFAHLPTRVDPTGTTAPTSHPLTPTDQDVLHYAAGGHDWGDPTDA